MYRFNWINIFNFNFKNKIINIENIEKYGIESLSLLPNKNLLTGVTFNNIFNSLNYCFIQFKLNAENNNLIEISKKDNVHG